MAGEEGGTVAARPSEAKAPHEETDLEARCAPDGRGLDRSVRDRRAHRAGDPADRARPDGDTVRRRARHGHRDRLHRHARAGAERRHRRALRRRPADGGLHRCPRRQRRRDLHDRDQRHRGPALHQRDVFGCRDVRPGQRDPPPARARRDDHDRHGVAEARRPWPEAALQVGHDAPAGQRRHHGLLARLRQHADRDGRLRRRRGARRRLPGAPGRRSRPASRPARPTRPPRPAGATSSRLPTARPTTRT